MRRIWGSLLLGLWLLAGTAGAEIIWEQSKADGKRNIQGYVAQEEGKRLKSFKVEARFQSSLTAILGVFADFDNYPNWVYKATTAQVLQQISPTEYYMYIVHDAPFGIEDRDVVLRGSVVQDPQSRVITLTTTADPGFITETTGLVRMTAEELVWKFTPLADGWVHLELSGYADPGGNIPSWTANMVQLDAPFQSVRNLIRQVETGHYDNVVLPQKVLEYENGYLPTRRLASADEAVPFRVKWRRFVMRLRRLL